MKKINFDNLYIKKNSNGRTNIDLTNSFFYECLVLSLEGFGIKFVESEYLRKELDDFKKDLEKIDRYNPYCVLFDWYANFKSENLIEFIDFHNKYEVKFATQLRNLLTDIIEKEEKIVLFDFINLYVKWLENFDKTCVEKDEKD